MAEHALLSASSSSRWINCPPSARLEETVEEEASQYAREGSFAHTLAELYLAHHLELLNKNEYHKKLKKLKQGPFYSQELDDYVKSYVDLALEKINQARAGSPDTTILLETKLDYSPWVPGGFGTGDLVLVTQGIIEVMDLKYGQGVPVSARENSQMCLYALGALNQFGCLYEINNVRMTIAQPRLDSISSHEMTVDDLLYWATNTVMGAARKAFKGEGDFQPGEHCRFCRVRSTCRARARENMKLARHDFKEPPLLKPQEVVEVLKAADELQRWASDVQGYALGQAVNHGREWPGYKLVEGRSTRKYADQEKAAEALKAAGYSEDKIFEKTLLGITRMEKTLGKKQFEKVLSGVVEKPPGKVKLAPETDKRPAVKSTSQIDFK